MSNQFSSSMYSGERFVPALENKMFSFSQQDVFFDTLTSSNLDFDTSYPLDGLMIMNDSTSSSGSGSDSGSDSPIHPSFHSAPPPTPAPAYQHQQFAVIAPGATASYSPLLLESTAVPSGFAAAGMSAPSLAVSGVSPSSVSALSSTKAVTSSTTTPTRTGAGRVRHSRVSRNQHSPAAAAMSSSVSAGGAATAAAASLSSASLLGNGLAVPPPQLPPAVAAGSGSALSSASAPTLTLSDKPKRRKAISKKMKEAEEDDAALAISELPSEMIAGSGGSGSGSVSVPAQKLRKLKEDAELKRKRLDRKAELARNSRRKKKMRVVELEEQVAQLTMQLNEALNRSKDMESHCHILSMQAQTAAVQVQAANQAASEALNQAAASASAMAATAANAGNCTNCAGKSKTQDILGMTGALQELLASNVHESKVGEALSQCSAALRANGPSSSAAVSDSVQHALLTLNHVSTLTRVATELMDKLLAPAMPIRVLRWAMSQPDKFYADANGLWNSLLKQDLGITPQQLAQLDELRAYFRACAAVLLDFNSGATLDSAVQKLMSDFRRQMHEGEQGFETFRSILSTEQMGKFLSWVERYGNVLVKINL